jgi:acetyltransferase-like isoleucine patch superfamily enzyme
MKDQLYYSVQPRISRELLRIGKDSLIDESALVGYLPSRQVEHTLTIGPGARIRSGAVIYGGTRIGSNLETGHNVIIREENDIGDNFRIWDNSVVNYGCRIGNNVKIHNKVCVSQYTLIEDDVFLAPGVTCANDIHPGCPDSVECMRGPSINKGAQIGINCTILPRVVIGEYSIIGAGSVVTRDIPAGVVAYGNPAQVICDIGDLKCSTGLRDTPYSHLIGRV